MKVKLKSVTPAMAAKWLATNAKNRVVNKWVVKRIADDILAGRWLVNGQSIVIDKNGALVDGQHRLHAIVLANVSVSSIVTEGVEPESMSTIDSGKNRNFSDVCSINGEKNACVLAAATKILYRYDRASINNACPASNALLEDFLDEHPGMRDSAAVGSSLRHVWHASVLAFCHYVFTAVDKDRAAKFFEGLCEGANLAQRSPVLQLRNKLLEIRGAKHVRLQLAASLELIFRAWNLYRSGKTVTRLPLPREAYPKIPDPGPRKKS